MVQGSVLVPLSLENAQQDAPLLDYAVRNSRGAVYILCTGPASSLPTTATLDYLTHCLEPAAHSKPRCDVFPLLQCVGWSPERVAERLTDVEEVVAAAEHTQDCNALVDLINESRQKAGLPSVSLTLTSGHHEPEQAAGGESTQQQHDGSDKGSGRGANAGEHLAAQQQQQQQQQGGGMGGADSQLQPGSRIIGDWPSPQLQFNKVAVGGTFDRMHAGHRLLLAATALVSKHSIFVGITADALLASKKNSALLESYEEREAAAVGYMQVINPGATVVAGPLTDPKEPPLCAVDPEFDALVVSEETLPGAHAINQTRAGLGFPPVVIVVVGLIYSRRRATKLSSTDLREEDAAAASGGRA